MHKESGCVTASEIAKCDSGGFITTCHANNGDQICKSIIVSMFGKLRNDAVLPGVTFDRIDGRWVSSKPSGSPKMLFLDVDGKPFIASVAMLSPQHVQVMPNFDICSRTDIGMTTVLRSCHAPLSKKVFVGETSFDLQNINQSKMGV